jgi:hypothetical protein
MFSHTIHQRQNTTFDFSMQTSSGDKINLSSYATQESSLESIKDEGLTSTALSLRESYGYSFTYEGNGISEQDKKEIDAALEKIRPILSILNPDEKFQKNDKSVTNTAMDINALLPKSEDSNMTNYMKDSLITMMDEMMKAFKANDQILALAKDVFDQLDQQMKGLNLYA